MSDKKLVKDYKGNLVPKAGSRKIAGKYYREGISCFLMEDGQWYRIDSPKIIFDHYEQKFVLASNGGLMQGFINEKGEIGYFSNQAYYISLFDKKGVPSTPYTSAMNEKIAIALGYEECIGDGLFYRKEYLTEKDRETWFSKKSIPKNERSSSYNLEQDPDKKKRTIELYEKSTFPLSVTSRRLAKLVPFTVGMEVEVINGFLPNRIRHKYGFKALKDGSLRQENGEEGIEYVSMPMSGPKGIQTIIDVMKEFSKRCAISNYCSLHFHFGNVRKDKLYVLSFYKLMTMLQGELFRYFPYSRFNSIKPDGKIYCKPLDPLGINYKRITSAKTEEEFRTIVVYEFNKIYMWLNGGKSLAEEYAEPTIVRKTKEINGKKMFCDVWMKNIYTTKEVHHAIQGQKWDKPSRYYIVNFLNLFFSKIGTIEFRCHESTTNANKALVWLLTCSSILKYAENVNKVFNMSTITLEEVLKHELPSDLSEYIIEYFKMRNRVFFSENGSYRQKWSNVEANWFNNDPSFKFTSSKNHTII